MPEPFIALLATVAVLSCGAALLTAKLAVRMQDLRDRLARFEARPIASDSPSASLSARLDELEQTVEVLANRVKMQKVRNAALHAERAGKDDLPDPYKEPDRWREAVNKRLASAKLPA
jgi:hypothetical protein